MQQRLVVESVTLPAEAGERRVVGLSKNSCLARDEIALEPPERIPLYCQSYQTFRNLVMSDTEVVPGAGALNAEGYAPSLQLFQFCGLIWATEYNAREAGLEKGIDAQTVNAMNTLLMAFAALEALFLETALIVHPQVYSDKQFRRSRIIEQYEKYLEADGRKEEKVHPIVAEVSRHRIALTHSEPDHERSFVLSQAISATLTWQKSQVRFLYRPPARVRPS